MNQVMKNLSAAWERAPSALGMLNKLGALTTTYRPSQRQFRLFGLECLRAYQHQYHPEARAVVEQLAVYIEATPSNPDPLFIPCLDKLGGVVQLCQHFPNRLLLASEAVYLFAQACRSDLDLFPDVIALLKTMSRVFHSRAESHHGQQAELLREIVGNPYQDFHLPHILDAVPIGQAQEIVAIASSIYTEQNWTELPLLADALEDANYADHLSQHFRQARGHVRGCWALDRILENILVPKDS